mmetsp:Transcript_24100/g.51197  ORF Transcript_24100/g.51197 Transcript_24100/m.51197 type:complete len:150 (+) Transcript_24100:262-711(+)
MKAAAIVPPLFRVKHVYILDPVSLMDWSDDRLVLLSFTHELVECCGVCAIYVSRCYGAAPIDAATLLHSEKHKTNNNVQGSITFVQVSSSLPSRHCSHSRCHMCRFQTFSRGTISSFGLMRWYSLSHGAGCSNRPVAGFFQASTNGCPW